MESSFLEIYNETIRDLLATADPNVKHEIKQIVTNTGKQASDVYVTNLKTVTVKSPNQVGKDHVVLWNLTFNRSITLYVELNDYI